MQTMDRFLQVCGMSVQVWEFVGVWHGFTNKLFIFLSYQVERIVKATRITNDKNTKTWQNSVVMILKKPGFTAFIYF